MSCEVWLERDECILGVFRDCTVPPATPREWRGRDDAVSVRLDAFYPSAVAPARAPGCCEGPIPADAPEGEPEWLQLTCGPSPCSGSRSHVGLYVEAAVEPRPAGQVRDERPLPGPAVDAAGDWLLVAGAGPAVDGLYADLELPIRARSIEDGQGLAVDPSGAPWVIGPGRVYGPGGLEVELDVSPLALAATASGAVVVSTGSVARVEEDGTLRVEAPWSGLGTPVGAVASPDGAVYVLTENPATLVPIDPELRAGAPVDLSADVAGPPRWPTWLDEQIVFTGRCHRVAEGEHCLYAVDPARLRVRRLGLPDGTRLGRPVRVGTDRWWVPDEGGWIHVVEPSSFRPRLFERIPAPPGLRFLLLASSASRAVHGVESLWWTIDASRSN